MKRRCHYKNRVPGKRFAWSFKNHFFKLAQSHKRKGKKIDKMEKKKKCVIASRLDLPNLTYFDFFKNG